MEKKAKPETNPEPQQTRRGLTPAQYHICWRRVRDGKTTWKKLEEAGVCQPANATRTTDFAQQVDAMIAEAKTVGPPKTVEMQIADDATAGA